MTDWSQIFRDVGPALPGSGWVGRWRTDALARFTEAGLPHPRAEAWKHTPLRALTRTAFSVDPAPTRLRPSPPASVPDATPVVLVDGTVVSTGPLPTGVTVTPLADALAAGDARLAALVSRAPEAVNAPFDALNAALVTGGTFIEVAPRADVGALHLIHHTTGDAHRADHLRHLVVAGPGSRVTVFEEHATGPGLHHRVSDVLVEDDADVDHVILHHGDPAALHLADLRVHLGRSSRYRGHVVAVGGAWTRTGIRAVLGGDGGTLHLGGAVLGRDRQHHDQTVRVDHDARHCTSDQVFRGVLADRSRGVLRSLLVVGPGGADADGAQDLRSLLLSDRAHADTEPQLEIHTDAVKASHGSTIGKLDDEALFYLRARGLDASTARRLLTGAFARDVVGRVRHRGARERVLSVVDRWLAEAVR